MEALAVQKLTQLQADHVLPSTLLSWQAKYASSAQCRSEGRTAAPLDLSSGKKEFDGWIKEYLPPPHSGLKSSHVAKVRSISFLFGFMPEMETIDIEPGGCGSLRLFLGGSATLITTPLSSLKGAAGGILESIEEAQTIFSKLAESAETFNTYIASNPVLWA